jgi:GDP-L-fucose synthase
MQHYEGEGPINVGWGEDVSIGELARMVANVVGYRGALQFDPSKPDGTPRKLLDTSRLTALGWRPTITLEAGLTSTYEWYVSRTQEGHAQGLRL